MSVTSTTLAGVNVWQFSGAVTDTEIKTAWASLIVNNRYLLARAIYIDSTCSLLNVRGTYYIDSQNLGIILHSSRNKANTLFRNWFFTQTVGLSVGARSNFVRFTNGTTISNSVTDGIDMQGGGMMYAVVGNPGGGDPRYLNEMMFGSLDGTLVTSTAWTEQEIEPTSIGTIWKGLNIQRAAGYPILGALTGSQRQVIYRSNFNTEGASLRLVRPYYNNSICYVSSIIRRQGVPVSSNLLDTYGSSGSAVIMVLNNFTDETWFGVSKTSLTGANWNAGNRVIGGVLKRIQVQPNTLIRTYDSRSTSVSQKSTFSETTSDFLAGTDSTTSDVTTGKAQFVCVGAIATGASIGITRYTGQKFTLQKFGYRVQIETLDMTFGDDDLSAYSPITMTQQNGISRTLAAINLSSTIGNYQELLEELHLLAISLVGSVSYNGFNSGNLFIYEGGILTTNFSVVNVDANAASKISFDSSTNTLTIKVTVLIANSIVTRWNNPSGSINLLNGASIQGVYQSSAGTATIFEFSNLDASSKSACAVWDASNNTNFYLRSPNSTERLYFKPGNTLGQLTAAIARYGSKYQSIQFNANAGGIIQFPAVYKEQVGITQADVSIVEAYNLIPNPSTFLDRSLAYGLTESGIKLGEFVVRSGTTIEIGNFSKVIHTNPSTGAFNVSNNVITIRASSYEPDNSYTKEIANPPATITANSNEIISIFIEDANGDSTAFISGTSGNLVDVWKIPNATAVYDFASGQKISSNIGNGAYRFIHQSGYKLVFNNKDNGIYRYCSMDKGEYDVGWYLYDKPTGGLTQQQSDLLTTISAKNNDIYNDVNSLMTDFIESTDSLHAISNAIDILPTLTEIESSEVLAKATDLAAVKAKTDNLPANPAAVGDAMALTNAYDAAKNAASQDSVNLLGSPLQGVDYTAPDNDGIDLILDKVNTLNNTDISDLATQTNINNLPTAIRTELQSELSKIDAAISSRSTLTVEDIPEGITVEEIKAAIERPNGPLLIIQTRSDTAAI